MDYSDVDRAELKQLLASLKAGDLQVSLAHKGKPATELEHERFIRHLIYLDFLHARSKSTSGGE